MKQTTSIEIDLDVYKAIQQNLEYIGEQANDVLRRVFKLNETLDSKEIPKAVVTEGLYTSGTLLPNGLKLRRHYKGNWYFGEVVNKKIVVNKKKFNAPSAAAIEVTKTSVNGWVFWEYQDAQGNWRTLAELRKDK